MALSCPTEDALLSYLNREASPPLRASVEAHLASCDECRSLVSTLASATAFRPSTRAAIDPFGATILEDHGSGAGAATFAPSPHAPFRPSPGARIDGKYQLECELGHGGMGSVWAAYHELLRQRIAIKFLHGTLANDEAVRQRFLLEARSMAKLSGEHVVRVLDADVLPNGEPYLAMELLSGKDMSRIIAERGAMPASEVCDLALQAALGLAEAHAAGIVHRDVKPSNLFVTERRDGAPAVKLLDFGLAKALTASRLSITESGVIMGTPRYMAPEQLASTRDVDNRADIWALGAVMYEMLCGVPAFDAGSTAALAAQILTSVPASPRAVRRDIPPKLEAAVLRALSRDLAVRITLPELAAELAAFASDEGRVIAARIGRISRRDSLRPSGSSDSMRPKGAPAESLRPVAPRSRPSRLVVAGALVSALLGAGLVFAAVRVRPASGIVPSQTDSARATATVAARPSATVNPTAHEESSAAREEVSEPSVAVAVVVVPSASAQSSAALATSAPAFAGVTGAKPGAPATRNATRPAPDLPGMSDRK